MFGEKRCSLRLKLVDDLPGEHVYIHSCRRCDRENGPEFVVFHESTGKHNDPVPVVTAPVCTGRPDRVATHISERFEASGDFGLAVANA
jgi:hypothetical protein